MADIGSITQAAGYTGAPHLGGALGVGVQVDTAPLDRLAQFNFYKDRDMWEQQQKDNAIAAKQVADIAAYDTSSPFVEYSNDLRSRLKEIQEMMRNNPNALQYNKDPNAYLALNEKINEFNVRRKGATANDTLFNAAKARIDLIPDRAVRAKNMALLDLRRKKLFAGGLDRAYESQFEVTPELKPSNYAIPKVALTQDFIIKRNPNDIITYGSEYADINRLKDGSVAAYLGLGKALDETTPEFQKLSEDEKAEARLQNELTFQQKDNLDKIATSANTLVSQFKESSGNANAKISDLPPDVLAKDPTVGGYITLAKQYNETIDRINKDSGQNYSHINLDDNVSGAEIIELQSFGASPNSFFKELKPDIQVTGEAQKKEQLARGWAGLNWDKEKFKLAQTGTDIMKSGATKFAERIYSELKGLADANGVIDPSKLRRLTAEQRKYLGYDKDEVDPESGKVIKGLKPLEITAQDETGSKDAVDAIQLVNGQIKILKNAKKTDAIVNGVNQWEGLWDETRTTTISNIATNRLNEQLKTAGTKELNTYLPLDVWQPGVQTTVTGGGTQVSGSTSQGGGAKERRPLTQFVEKK